MNFATVEDILKHTGIPRPTLYRLKKQGLLKITAVETDNGLVYQFEDHRRMNNSESLVQEWIAWREGGIGIKPWSPQTRKKYVRYLDKHLARYGSVSVSSLETHLMSIPATQPLKRIAIHAACSSFARFLKEKKGLLTHNDYCSIRLLYPKLSYDYKPSQQIISAEDLACILHYADYLDRAFIGFLSETGLRVGEACELKMQDLMFSDEPKLAKIKDVVGKGGKSRVVPFSRKAQEFIREYLKIKPGLYGDYVFVMKRSRTKCLVETMGHRFERLSKRCGVPFSAHSFRHYRITIWANNPLIPITTTQKWAGHETLAITQRYIHTTDDMALAAAYE